MDLFLDKLKVTFGKTIINLNESIRMLKVSYIVNSVYSSRSYIIAQEGSSKSWLVDCGDVLPLVERLTSMVGGSFSMEGVLLTHAHYDHMYGLPRLISMFPEVRIYTNKYGQKMLANERKNFSRYHEDPINFESENVIVCEDGDEIELFEGIKAIVHETPGHNPSCISYEVGDYLFTGDSFIPGIKVVTNLPGGNKEQAAQSVEKVLKWAEGKALCPGHVVE